MSEHDSGPQHAHEIPEHPTDRPRLPRWFWPAAAAMSLVLGLIGGLLGGRLAGGSGTDIGEVAREALPSSVQIAAEANGVPKAETGSGFVYDDQGHVVTNNHVVAESVARHGAVSVLDQDGDEHQATVVGRSQVYDLAVLDVPDLRGRIDPAELGSSADVSVGETVVAIGSPLGLTATVTSGIVSALHRPVTAGQSDDSTSFIDAIQTDAGINPGNSGGPLVDTQGRVIGVDSAFASGSDGAETGVGFAIPIDQVKRTTQQILEDGHATFPVMGAGVAPGSSTDGARITAVAPGSPAAGAGVRVGDLVTELDGQHLTDGAGLITGVRAHEPGDRVQLQIERGGQTRTVSMTLGKRSE